MKKIKFSELLKQDNVVIHTPKEKQAKKLFKVLDELNYHWCNHEKIVNNEEWHIFKTNTCYVIYLSKNIQYCCIKRNLKVVEFKDIDFGNDDLLKKANTLRIVYIVSMMVLLVSIEASLILILYLNNKIFFALTIVLTLILIGIGVVAEQKSEDNYDKVHNDEIKNLKLGYEDELISSGNKLYETLEEKNKLARKIKALRDYKGIYIDKSITSDGVPSKESLLKDIGDDIDLLTPTEDKGMVREMTPKEALEILLGGKYICVLSARSYGKEEYVEAIKTIKQVIELLEIIKVKQVDIEYIGLCADEERYNRAFVPKDDYRKLTQDEFDKVRSWLKNDK